MCYIGHCISFPLGYISLIEKDKFISFCTYYYPKHAQGLAYIANYNKQEKCFTTRYCFPPGSHTQVDMKCKTVLDSSFFSYIRTVYNGNDSGDINKYFNNLKNKISNTDIIKRFKTIHKSLDNYGQRLFTKHNTVICINDSGYLCHSKSYFDTNISIEVLDNKIYIKYNSLYIQYIKNDGKIIFSKSKIPLEIVQNQNNTISLKINNSYISARENLQCSLVNYIK